MKVTDIFECFLITYFVDKLWARQDRDQPLGEKIEIVLSFKHYLKLRINSLTKPFFLNITKI
jgi:hypothetical protein